MLSLTVAVNPPGTPSQVLHINTPKAILTLHTWFVCLSQHSENPVEDVQSLLNSLQSPTLVITLPVLTAPGTTEEIIAVHITTAQGTRTVFKDPTLTSSLINTPACDGLYDIALAFKPIKGSPYWSTSALLHDLEIIQDHNSEPLRIPSQLTPALQLPFGAFHLPLGAVSISATSTLRLNIQEINELSSAPPNIPMLTEPNSKLIIELLVVYLCYQVEEPYELQARFIAPGIATSAFDLNVTVELSDVASITATFRVQLQRFLVCYQQFHQLISVFAASYQVPVLVPLYRCTWSLNTSTDTAVFPHRIAWSLNNDYALSYRNTHTAAYRTATPFNTETTLVFDPNTLPSMLEPLIPDLQREHLQLLTC